MGFESLSPSQMWWAELIFSSARFRFLARAPVPSRGWLRRGTDARCQHRWPGVLKLNPLTTQTSQLLDTQSQEGIYHLGIELSAGTAGNLRAC